MGNEETKPKRVQHETVTVVRTQEIVKNSKKIVRCCPTCGQTNHDYNRCKYEASLCKICRKPGHTEKNCLPSIETLQIPKGKKTDAEKKCYVCGGTNHDFYKCQYDLAKCQFCGKVGHGEMACRKNPVVKKMMEIQADSTNKGEKQMAIEHGIAKKQGIDNKSGSVQNQINESGKQHSNNNIATGATKKEKRCPVCGKMNHDFNYCKYKKSLCKICKKPGHEASACSYGANRLQNQGQQSVHVQQAVKIIHTTEATKKF